MKKIFRRTLALVMALILLMGGSVSAAAISTMSRNDDYITTYKNYQNAGTFIIDSGKTTTVTVPKIYSGAKYFEFYSDDESIISVAGDMKLRGVNCGATIITIYEYDKNHNLIWAITCIGIVVDSVSKAAKGTLAAAYDITVNMNYKDTTYISPSVKTNGDAFTYIILPNHFYGDAVSVEGSDCVRGIKKGTDTISAIVVDTKGNYKIVDVTFNVKFTFVQWIIWILLLGFIWY
ncbi:MAG: hypothetical protein MJ147_04760 [Clostridia bacterium]|nr:hypothetical protein [Clostridia bacterium]